jgi:3D (Asp-Asp-Asp) domain-containing protein
MNIFLIAGVLFFSVGSAPLNGMLKEINPIEAAFGAYEEAADHHVGVFTAYTPSVAETDSTPRIMASGNEVYVGAIACPSAMDFGTRIRIIGMGLYTCEDRMARRHRIKKHRFDIFMNTRKEALRFGVQKLKYQVVVLEDGGEDESGM